MSKLKKMDIAQYMKDSHVENVVDLSPTLQNELALFCRSASMSGTSIGNIRNLPIIQDEQEGINSFIQSCHSHN